MKNVVRRRLANLTSFGVLTALSSIVLACSSGAPAPEDPAMDELTEDAAPLGDARNRERADRDILLQAGSSLVPLGLTDDDYFFYQEGGTVYVTSLRQGAARASVAEIPGGNTAFMYPSGKVAFLWTNPDYSSPSFGVSPLVIWTAAHGAHEVSGASPVGTLTTVASLDGEYAIFPSNADAAGTRGDIVEVSTDLSAVRTLAAGVQTDYTNGPCRPLSTYVGHHRRATPAIAYCAGDETTSTLTTFFGGVRSDVPGLTNPPLLTANPARSALMVERADGTPLLVTAASLAPIEELQAGFATFLGDNAALYVALAPDGSVGMRRATLRRGATLNVVQAIPAIASIFFNGFGSDALVAPATSKNGRWFAFGTSADPTTGLSNVALVDVRANDPASTIAIVEAATEFGTSAQEEPFTADSRFVLYGKPNPLGTTQLYAASVATRSGRPISDPNGYLERPATGSLVVFNDNVAPNAAGTAYVGDIKVVDVSAQTITPTVVARGANITFFLDNRRRHIVYVTDEAEAGVHVARLAGH